MARPRLEEIATRVWTARVEPCDVTVGVIGGDDGVLVVDAPGSLAAGRALCAAVTALDAGPVLGVVHTHAHLDHVLGAAAFRELDPAVPVHAQSEAVAALDAAARGASRALHDDLLPHLDAAEQEAAVAAPIVVPDRPLSSVRALDLGGRLVELVHPGRGHTAGDLVVRVPDVDLVLAGDLVEGSGPPSYGPDAHPLDWPASLDVVLGLLTGRSIVLPGHGAPMDRDAVEEQRALLGVVAETIRDLATRGVPADEALAVAPWPFPSAGLEHAVARGYAALPLLRRRLPLL